MVEWTVLVVFSVLTWSTRAAKWIIWVCGEGEQTQTDKSLCSDCEGTSDRSVPIWAMASLSSSGSICTSRRSSFQVKKKFRFQRTVSREVTRRQVILVPTNKMEGVPSRVWKAKRKPSFTKHQCYLEVGSLLCERDRLLQVEGRLQYSDLPEGTKHPIILPHGHPVV